jgi:hypothetical protein
LPFQIETTAHERNFDTLRQKLAQSSYFLFKDGGEPESPVFNPYIAQLIPLVANDPRYTEILVRSLPDRGIARIFKNSAPHARSVEGVFSRNAAPPDGGPAIDFGGVLSLTSVSTVKTPDSLTVQFRWRCLKPPDRDYWCFTHLIDQKGKILTQLDHRLLGGEPPLLSWRTGDSGSEEIRFVLPAGAGASGWRLRFGLYDPPSGKRLTVRSLQGAAAREFTLTDRDTTVLSPIPER